MKKHYFQIGAVALLLSMASCDSSTKSGGAAETSGSDTATVTTDTAAHAGSHGGAATGQVMEKDGLKVYSFDDSPKFPDAVLKLNKPEANSKIAKAGPVEFDYAISNFQLTDQTTGAEAHHMANSHEGQHIHNIVDNEPYTAHYETKFSKDLKAGHHVILSFLSRSYHESLKHKTAYDLRTVTVGQPKEANNFDVNGQHMFYSRPKGEYKGEDTKVVMLDFYLVNTDLSPEGNKVRATINGTAFMLDKWLPYKIEGLPMGENTIKLELLDKDGKVIPGPYNTVERKITLKEA